MAGKSILIVDDDSTIRRLLMYHLEKAGYDVSIAEDGVEGLAKVESLRPNVVVTDLMMAFKDGFELARDIRSRKEFDEIAIIVLTARDHLSDVDELLASGVNCVMKKPFNPQELTKTVRELTGEK
ncbi:MAG: response regulator transcription factor [Ignavibacteriales bacterium]|nr:response regulator transcription factor [Ignavibacteriales bacterium]